MDPQKSVFIENKYLILLMKCSIHYLHLILATTGADVIMKLGLIGSLHLGNNIKQ